MTGGHAGAAGRYLQILFQGGTFAALSDAQLLERFLSCRDEQAEAAFAAIVGRHVPMVLAVCRRVLVNEHDAQDAAQATFLLLARRASAIRRRESVGPWLHGVAVRVARRARARDVRRRAFERRGREGTAGPDDRRARTDLGPELREEVELLPSKYRDAVVLCHLEGLTHEEAADRLGWPVGTVKGRLSRAQALLRARLERLGVALAVGSWAAARGRPASAAVPSAWVEATTRAATRLAAGEAEEETDPPS